MKRYIIATTILLTGLGAKAQYVLREADKQYSLYSYSKSAELYEKAYAKRHSARSAERAGYSHARMGDYAGAEKWYGLAASAPDATAQSIMGYGRALMAAGRYAEAKVQFNKIQNGQADPNLLGNLKLSCDSAPAWLANPSKDRVAGAEPLNGPASDWAPTLRGADIVFASDRGHASSGKLSGEKRPFLKFDGRYDVPGREAYLWTGREYYGLYEASADSIGRFPLDAGTGYHVGSPNFSADGKEFFFTLTQVPEKLKSDTIATLNIEIYSSKLENGIWTSPKAFAYNKRGYYSVDDPFIKGDTLYFSSDMPGGRGGSDLYYSVRSGDSWGQPVPLVWANTAGDERSPAIGADGKFYFASNGLVGLGGLDIYRADEGGTNIENLKSPLNSPKDDFAFALNGLKGITYLSSDRDGGKGLDDIYAVEMMKIEKAIRYWLAGKVYDKATGLAIAGAAVEVTAEGGKSYRLTTGADGSYRLEVSPGTSYTLEASKTGYGAEKASVAIAADTLNRRDFYLAGAEAELLELPTIYYNFDKYNIRPDAAGTLDRVVGILNKYPDLRVVLGSHTDSRGSDAYNLWLSQKRAESAVSYLISHGVDRGRIRAKGYGETMLVNKCGNGVPCTVPEHQANRRTEIKKDN